MAKNKELPSPVKVTAQFAAIVLIYGAIINIAASVILGYKTGIIESVGWGLAWWLLRYELPELVKEYKKR